MLNFKEIKIRKGFLTAVCAGLLALAPVGAKAGIQQHADVVEIEGEEVVLEQPSANLEQDHVPLALQEPDVFTSDYGESKIARRMTREEKARNAAENDGWGGAITIIAMCIVISALLVLSILFLIFGKISEAILTSKKKKAKAAAAHLPTDDHSLAPGEVIAAISLALADYLGNHHDVEDTILTIRRLQRNYSPWNSKIYNLRQVQDHRRNNQ
ncbi:MAG: OadG family protein [Muribaculaceae bacterium]|nr:OadG family protein [Muribaculaceae bacterium]